MAKQPFHLVTPSPWPLLSSVSALFFVCGLILSWSSRGVSLLLLGLFLLLVCCFMWWSDIIRESTVLGFHTIRVQFGLRIGIGLFIVSEIFFFLGFF
jgi:hypothetical protein